MTEPNKQPTAEELEEALSALLVTIINHRAAKEAATVRPYDFNPMPFKWTDTIPSRELIAVEGIIADPIEGALRHTLRFIGERLFKQGGTDLMRDALYAVADRDEKHGGRMLAIADSQWSGIGDDSGRWWS